jgi:hypothetical protein
MRFRAVSPSCFCAYQDNLILSSRLARELTSPTAVGFGIILSSVGFGTGGRTQHTNTVRGWDLGFGM